MVVRSELLVRIERGNCRKSIESTEFETISLVPYMGALKNSRPTTSNKIKIAIDESQIAEMTFKNLANRSTINSTQAPDK